MSTGVVVLAAGRPVPAACLARSRTDLLVGEAGSSCIGLLLNPRPKETLLLINLIAIERIDVNRKNIPLVAIYWLDYYQGQSPNLIFLVFLIA